MAELSYHQKYYLKNKERMKANAKAHREANREYHSEYNRQYALDNKERLDEYHVDYRKANAEEATARTLKWQRNNPDKVRDKTAARKAAKLQATPPWLTDEAKAHMQRTYRLAAIIQDETGVKYHVDHVIPLQGKNVCGLHIPSNLVVIEASANLSKSNKFK